MNSLPNQRIHIVNRVVVDEGVEVGAVGALAPICTERVSCQKAELFYREDAKSAKVILSQMKTDGGRSREG